MERKRGTGGREKKGGGGEEGRSQVEIKQQNSDEREHRWGKLREEVTQLEMCADCCPSLPPHTTTVVTRPLDMWGLREPRCHGN